jgi:hypothetical protein
LVGRAAVWLSAVHIAVRPCWAALLLTVDIGWIHKASLWAARVHAIGAVAVETSGPLLAALAATHNVGLQAALAEGVAQQLAVLPPLVAALVGGCSSLAPRCSRGAALVCRWARPKGVGAADALVGGQLPALGACLLVWAADPPSWREAERL